MTFGCSTLWSDVFLDILNDFLLINIIITYSFCLQTLAWLLCYFKIVRFTFWNDGLMARLSMGACFNPNCVVHSVLHSQLKGWDDEPMPNGDTENSSWKGANVMLAVHTLFIALKKFKGKIMAHSWPAFEKRTYFKKGVQRLLAILPNVHTPYLIEKPEKRTQLKWGLIFMYLW